MRYNIKNLESLRDKLTKNRYYETSYRPAISLRTKYTIKIL